LNNERSELSLRAKRSNPFSVIAGLDPAIHPLRKAFSEARWNARVKPEHDESGIASSQQLLAMTAVRDRLGRKV
jgi:hypothetical protein